MFIRSGNITNEDIYERFNQEWPTSWEKAATLLEWMQPYETILEERHAPAYRWFPDGMLNAAENCIDRHVDADQKNRVALKWIGKRGECRTYTYHDLQWETMAFAAALQELGVEEGDVVTIYLPTVPELPIAMLACARLGALHNVVFAGFAPDALVDRMKQTHSRVLITCDGFYWKETAIDQKRKADTAVQALQSSISTVIVDRLADVHPPPLFEDQYIYGDLIEHHEGVTVPPVPRDANAPLFIIYTSGATGKPKKVIHTTGGYLVGTAWTSHAVLDLKVKDTYWCTADSGWVTGHSYVVYGPLALGTTVLLYEGTLRYPDRHRPWELIDRHSVDIFYTDPGTIRTFMKWGESYPAKHDLSSLRLLGSVGEPIGSDTWEWFFTHVGGEDCPIVDTWWQTETGSIILSTLPGLSTMKPGSVGPPLPGVGVRIVDDHGEPVAPGESGYLTLTRPWPSMARPEDRTSFNEGYFAQYSDADKESWIYFTEDRVRIDEDGYISIIGRGDDIRSDGEYKLGRAELEATVMAVNGITEAAVVSRNEGPDPFTVFVTAELGRNDYESLRTAIKDTIEEHVGRVARSSEVIFTPELPETHSGKTMYRMLESIVEGTQFEGTDILRNPEIVGELIIIQEDNSSE